MMFRKMLGREPGSTPRSRDAEYENLDDNDMSDYDDEEEVGLRSPPPFKVGKIARKLDFPTNSSLQSDQVKTVVRIRSVDGSLSRCTTTESHDPQMLILQPHENGATKRYHFSCVYGERTTQRQFFEETILPCINKVFMGVNTCAFAYGPSGSGKTFSMDGSLEDPGFIPRTMDTIFRSIGHRQTRSRVQPIKFADYRPYTAAEADEVENKALLQPMVLVTVQATSNKPIPDARANPAAYKLSDLVPQQGKKRVFVPAETTEPVPVISDHSSVHLPDNTQYAVWMSCCEIYQKTVIDLLIEPPETALPQTRMARAGVRAPVKKKLEVMSDGFVMGLVEVRVRTMEEAYTLICRARAFRTVRSTNQNATSSRSHAIFTVKIVKFTLRDGCIIEDPKALQTSRILLADLAGSERGAKINNIKERQVEANMINSDLMSLNMCLNSLRAQQQHNIKSQPPWGQTCITKLLRPYFEGKGEALMIVNINPDREHASETERTLEVAAGAQKVRPEKQKIVEANLDDPTLLKRKLEPERKPADDPARRTRRSIPEEELRQRADVDMDEYENDGGDDEIDEEERAEYDEIIENLVYEIETLKEGRNALISQLLMQATEVENRVRSEMIRDFERQRMTYERNMEELVQRHVSTDNVDRRVQLISSHNFDEVVMLKQDRDKYANLHTESEEQLAIYRRELGDVQEKNAAALHVVMREKQQLAERVSSLEDQLVREEQKHQHAVDRLREDYEQHRLTSMEEVARASELVRKKAIDESTARLAEAESEREHLEQQLDEARARNEQLNVRLLEQETMLEHLSRKVEGKGGAATVKEVAGEAKMLVHTTDSAAMLGTGMNKLVVGEGSPVKRKLEIADLKKQAKKAQPFSVLQNVRVEGDHVERDAIKHLISPSGAGGFKVVITETETVSTKVGMPTPAGHDVFGEDATVDEEAAVSEEEDDNSDAVSFVSSLEDKAPRNATIGNLVGRARPNVTMSPAVKRRAEEDPAPETPLEQGRKKRVLRPQQTRMPVASPEHSTIVTRLLRHPRRR